MKTEKKLYELYQHQVVNVQSTVCTHWMHGNSHTPSSGLDAHLLVLIDSMMISKVNPHHDALCVVGSRTKSAITVRQLTETHRVVLHDTATTSPQ